MNPLSEWDQADMSPSRTKKNDKTCELFVCNVLSMIGKTATLSNSIINLLAIMFL
jgi:hypothetical protein